jgi:hypothetical protein
MGAAPARSRLVCCAANAWTGASPSKGLHYSENSAVGFLKMCTTRFAQWRTEEKRAGLHYTQSEINHLI